MIKKGTIPMKAPPEVKGFLLRGVKRTSIDYDKPLGAAEPYRNFRDECTDHGMWTVVDMTWTQKLAREIKDRSVLEIMAGGGHLAKALSAHGVDIIATDNFSWAPKRHKHPPVHPVEKMDARKAVKKYPRDILLVSWPPYEDDTICEACDLWGTEKLIIYIGEGDGGCNATDEFFELFDIIHEKLHLPQWEHIHDIILIGQWTRKKEKKNVRSGIQR
jgi:hypothetical protein